MNRFSSSVLCVVRLVACFATRGEENRDRTEPAVILSITVAVGNCTINALRDSKRRKAWKFFKKLPTPECFAPPLAVFYPLALVSRGDKDAATFCFLWGTCAGGSMRILLG